MDIETLFQKRWSSKEEKCPSLTLILAIVSPFQDRQFRNYIEASEKKDNKAKDASKVFFFGTSLGCDLQTYQSPCRNLSNFMVCGVCNLASEGFSHLVSPMIPLDSNPASAHHKAERHSDSYTYALLMCDIACTNTRKMKRKLCDIEGRPDGVDTVGVRNGSILRNMDEMRVYNADAVCPRYVLIYV